MRPKPAKECRRCGKRLYECPSGGWHLTKQVEAA